MATLKVYKCTNNFQCLGLKVILNHLYCVHSQNLSFKTKCVVPDCAVQFTKYNSLYKHVIKHHSKLYNNNNYNYNNNNNSHNNGDNNNTVLNCGNEELNIRYSSDQLLEVTNQNSNIDECSTRSPTTDNNDFFVDDDDTDFDDDDDDDIDDHYYSDEVEDDNEVSYLCYKFHYLYYLYPTNFFFHRVRHIVL